MIFDDIDGKDERKMINPTTTTEQRNYILTASVTPRLNMYNTNTVMLSQRHFSLENLKLKVT